MPFCIEGEDSSLARASSGTITKANRLDRCPFGYYTNVQAPNTCITNSQNPPSVRLKGSGSCRAGEVEDWGIYCVSNYGGVTRDAATGYATRDWNAIYSANNATPPRQADTPEGTQYTPAYLVIFGRVQANGSPIGGGATASAVQPVANTAPAPATTGDTRVGSMSPQRRTATALGLCPTYWVPGQPGSDLPDPNMCYPAPQATAIFPVGGVNDPCPEGYMNSVGWCMAATPAAQAAATQASAATTTTTQPGVNCPPPANNQQAAQAGAALGGLLGGRRGNSQAGAAVGGLLGQAVGGAAQRPPGCP